MDIQYGFWKYGNLSQEFHVHFLCSWMSTSMTKNVTALTTTRALEIAHILNQTHYLQPSPCSKPPQTSAEQIYRTSLNLRGNPSSNHSGAWSTWSHMSAWINKGTHRNINFPKHVCSPACIYQSNILWCWDYHRSWTPQATEGLLVDHDCGSMETVPTNKTPVSTPHHSAKAWGRRLIQNLGKLVVQRRKDP